MRKEVKTKEDFDDLRAVLNCLRHDCSGTQSAKKAAKIISAKTEIKIERVKEILKEIGRKK